MVDRAFGEVAELVHDVLDGGVLIALGHEQPLCGVEDAGARHLGVSVTCHGGLPTVLDVADHYRYRPTVCIAVSASLQRFRRLSPTLFRLVSFGCVLAPASRGSI